MEAAGPLVKQGSYLLFTPFATFTYHAFFCGFPRLYYACGDFASNSPLLTETTCAWTGLTWILKQPSIFEFEGRFCQNDCATVLSACLGLIGVWKSTSQGVNQSRMLRFYLHYCVALAPQNKSYIILKFI
jgi:hypothetical protein